MKEIVYFVLGVAWAAGVVLAKGFLMTCLAIWLPFYAWYLVVEKAMQLAGWI